MSINLSQRYRHKEAVGIRIRYARIDNVAIPQWINKADVAITPKVGSVVNIAENIDNGEYVIEFTPKYADNRAANPELRYTRGCPGLISFSAFIQSNNLIVQYQAPPDVPKVLIQIDYPNNGDTSNTYVNTGANISIPLPTDVNGDFFVYGQSICDESTGFYSPRSNAVVVTKNSDPSITQISQSDTGVGGTRTQVFNIGGTITAGNRFLFVIYSHVVTVVAVSGDTPASIAIKARDAINATTTGQWNDAGSAPSGATAGYPPTASASGSQLIVVSNYGNSFAVNAYKS